MTISQQQAMVFAGANATSIAVVQTAAIGSGRLLVAYGQCDAGKTISFSDDTGDGVAWTNQIGPIQLAATADYYLAWKTTGTTNGTGKTLTVNGGAGNSQTTGAFGEWKTDNSQPFTLDGTPVSVGDTTSTNPNAGNITTSSTSSVVVAFCITHSGGFSAGSGYTLDFIDGVFFGRNGGEWKVVAAGTYSTDFVAASTEWIAFAAAFKAAASGPTITLQPTDVTCGVGV